MKNFDNLMAIFLEEASEIVSQLETDILFLETNPNDSSLIEQVFRSMHTLKGAAGMYGFENINNLTHQLETIYDLIRSGEMQLETNVLNLTLKSVDIIKNLLFTETGSAFNQEDFEATLQDIKNVIDRGVVEDSEKGEEEDGFGFFMDDLSGYQTWYLLFTPDENVVRRGVNLKGIFDEIQDSGYFKIIPHPANDKNKTGQKFYIWWEILLSTKISEADLKDIFMFVEDEVEIIKLSEQILMDSEIFREELGQLITENQPIDQVLLAELVKRIAPEKTVEKFQIDTAPEMVQGSKADIKTSSIRVTTAKLDELMNMVSELVTTQAELSLIANSLNEPKLSAVCEKFQKLSRQLRDNALSVRLVPIDSIKTKLQRLVRDLAADLNKDVDFHFFGGETELDKTVIDGLMNPLMHILRNSLDHGLEPSNQRISKGKTPKGTITFQAFYSGTNVVIQVKDDGRGIDLEKVKNKAIDKGLIEPDAIPAEKDLIQILFMPGFSTAEKVSAVSGRGVGMDVVNREISDIRGKIDIQTQKDKGTTVSLSLPLTLSIIDSLHVQVKSSNFLIPLSLVDRCGDVAHSDLELAANKKIIDNNTLIPFVYLREEFKINGNAPSREKTVVVKYEDREVALIVDAIIGEHQTVLKPLGEIFKNHDIFSGGSILGDGTLAIVLDTNKLIDEFSKKHISLLNTIESVEYVN